MPEEKDKEQDECLECNKKKDARWRQDFPVEWESDNYVTRREMVKFLALGFAYHCGSERRGRRNLPHIVKASEMPRTQDRAGLFHSRWWIEAVLLSNRRRSLHSGSSEPTAIWLRIPRCARIFPAP